MPDNPAPLEVWLCKNLLFPLVRLIGDYNKMVLICKFKSFNNKMISHMHKAQFYDRIGINSRNVFGHTKKYTFRFNKYNSRISMPENVSTVFQSFLLLKNYCKPYVLSLFCFNYCFSNHLLFLQF